MTDQFLGEIRMFGGNFAPTGWALCNGQLLPLSQNTALFSLLGTQYGGNGQTNFALPNLQGAAPLMFGQGPGLSSRSIGQSGGSSAVSLTEAQVPGHGHSLSGGASTGTDTSPAGDGAGVGSVTRGQKLYGSTGGGPPMNATALATVGTGAPHNNMPPYLTVTFIIALQGIFPPRS